jgi:hypothetical protein
MAKKPETKEVAVKQSSEVAIQTEVPEFLKGKMGDTRGSEEVSSSDLIVPRIEVCQSLSKCRKKSDPSYIEGIQEGDIYNSVTREIYGSCVKVVPIYFRKEWLIWRDVDLGGGFGGSHSDEAMAIAAKQRQEKPEEWEIVDTYVHFVLIVIDGKFEEAVFSMAKSKAAVSRKWNSLIRLNEGARFSRMYNIRGVEAQNKNGQDYFNVDITNLGFVDESTYKKAESVYNLIVAGKIQADHTGGIIDDEDAIDAEM